MQTLLLLWQRFSYRYWRHNLGKSLMLLFIFALGIATYLAISMANRSAVAGFSRFTDTVTGQSNWTLLSTSGVLFDNALHSIREELSHHSVHITPILEHTATLPRQAKDPDYGRRTFQLIGLDLIQVQNLTAGAQALKSIQSLSNLADIWDKHNPIFITDKLAESQQIEQGDTFTLLIQDTLVEMYVIGLLSTEETTFNTPENLIVLDLPLLQQLAGLDGQLSRIEFFVTDDSPSDNYIAQLSTQLEAIAASHETWQLTSTEQSRSSAQTMTLAFRLNLLVLALIALLVALYLIAQALDASVVCRRREIATLRSLGVAPTMLLSAWLLEVIVFGIVGSALGILLGWGIAQVFVQAIAKTVNALYQVSEAQTVMLTSQDIFLGFTIGITASIVTGLLPAHDAASTPPAQILRNNHNESKGLVIFDKPWLGVILVLLGVMCYYIPPLTLAGGTRFPLAGFAAAFLWIMGGTIVVGTLFGPIGRCMKFIRSACVCWSLASARLSKATSRHKLAVSGLFIAIGMAAGMNILISSFAKTMELWIQTRFKADIYISSEAGQSASSLNRVSPKTWQSILAMPAVDHADVLQTFPITLKGKSTFISSANIALLVERKLLPWIEPPPGNAWHPASAHATNIPALINETFAERFTITSGAQLTIPTPKGQRAVRIVGVYADYGNERGTVLVDQPILSAWFNHSHATNLSLFLKSDYDAQTVLETLQSRYPHLALRTNETLRASILKIFNETFAITHAVKWIGVFVALIGLALSLISLIWESQPQLKTLAQLGMHQKEIERTIAYEGLGITFTGAIGGLLLSLPLGYLLIYVINKQSFGWTLQMNIPWAALGLLVLAMSLLGFVVAVLTTRCILTRNSRNLRFQI